MDRLVKLGRADEALGHFEPDECLHAIALRGCNSYVLQHGVIDDRGSGLSGKRIRYGFGEWAINNKRVPGNQANINEPHTCHDTPRSQIDRRPAPCVLTKNHFLAAPLTGIAAS